MTTAQFPAKCQDRCGLRIHVGDEIERGHYGWRHADCEKANLRAQIREHAAQGWGLRRLMAWLNNSPTLTLDQRIDGIAYASRTLEIPMEDAS